MANGIKQCFLNYCDGKRNKTNALFIIPMANVIKPQFVLYYPDGIRYKANAFFIIMMADVIKHWFNYSPGRCLTPMFFYSHVNNYTTKVFMIIQMEKV